MKREPYIDINTMRRNLTTPRTGASPAQYAYPGTRCAPERDDGGWKSYALAVVIGCGIGWLLAQI